MTDSTSAQPDPARSPHAVRANAVVRAALFEAVSDGIFLLENLRIVDCNTRACAIYGRNRDDLLGRSPMDLSPVTQPSGAESSVLAHEKMVAVQKGQPQRFEWQHLRPDGSVFEVEVSLSRIEQAPVPLLVAVVRDITQRNRAIAALTRRTAQLDAVRLMTAEIARELDLARLLRLLIARAAELVGATTGTVYLWDPTAEVLAAEAWHGLGDWQGAVRLRLGEAIAGTVAQTRQPLVVNEYRTSPYAHPLTLRHTELTASVGGPLLYREELIGAITLGHEAGNVFTDADAELLRLLATHAAVAIKNARLYDAAQRELRQREAAEAELRKIVRAVEQSPSIVMITDRTGAIEYVNPKFTEVTGYPLDEIRGQNPRFLKSGHMSAPEYARLWATLTAGGEWRGEFHNRRKDGTLYWEGASISPVRASEGAITHYVAVKEDITARKAADAAHRRSLEQLDALRATTADIIRQRDLDTLLQNIAARAAALLGVTHAVVHLWDETTERLVTRTVTGYDPWRATVAIRLGEGVVGAVAERRTALVENEYRTSPLAAPIFLERSPTTAMVAAPLLCRERLFGVLAVTNDGTTRQFAACDLELLCLFADQAAIAIENARLCQAAGDRRA